MNRPTRALCATLAFTAMLVAASPLLAKDPDTAIVSIYRIAPGKHAEFLKWMAEREAIGQQAGAAATQWYRHLDGDSWDYIAIAPGRNEAMDRKVDAMALKRGLTTGVKSGLELRTLIASHTDTTVAGPSTASAMVQEASGP